MYDTNKSFNIYCYNYSKTDIPKVFFQTNVKLTRIDQREQRES